MSSSKSGRAEALQLPLSERASLARELIASLDGPAESDAAEVWLVETERREAELPDPSKSEDWAAVRERIAARLRSVRA